MAVGWEVLMGGANLIFFQVFLKAHFDYDPKRDNLIPCRDAGLAFNEGDVLQVVNKDDPNWWQARKVDSDEKSGLIPSQLLEEKRKAFVRPEFDYTQNSCMFFSQFFSQISFPCFVLSHFFLPPVTSHTTLHHTIYLN